MIGTNIVKGTINTSIYTYLKVNAIGVAIISVPQFNNAGTNINRFLYLLFFIVITKLNKDNHAHNAALISLILVN